MPEYTCIICKFNTKLKSNYKRHSNTKKHNKAQLNYENTNLKKYIYNNTEQPEQSEDIPVSLKSHLHGLDLCKYCNKQFTSSHGARRHERKYCKLAKITNEIAVINNTTNITHTLNINTTNNIQINCFRREDVEFITHEMKTELLKRPQSMIPRLIKLVHFNDANPANNNIRIPNKNDKMLMIYIQDKWQYVDKKVIMLELINNKYSDLDEHFDNTHSKMTPNIKTNYEEYSKLFNTEDKQLMNKLYLKCHMMMLNARNEIIAV